MDDFYFELNDFEFEFCGRKFRPTSFIKTRTNPKFLQNKEFICWQQYLKVKLHHRCNNKSNKNFCKYDEN